MAFIRRVRTASGATAVQIAVGALNEDFSPAYGYTASCPASDASWTVTDIVQIWANGSANHGIRLAAVNEASNYTWRKYRSTNYGGDLRPHLEVTYSLDPVISEIMLLTGETEGEVLADLQAVVDEEGLSWDAAKQAMRDDLQEMADEIAGDSSAAAARIAAGGGTSSGKARIRLPAGRFLGDIAYAPNEFVEVAGQKPIRQGHAALYTTTTSIIHAPGPGKLVQEVSIDSVAAKSFAPGARMMSLYTDGGAGPLLGLDKRQAAVAWARTRVGDKYRLFSNKNTIVVSGAPGSLFSHQNCSQLVWAAFKHAANWNLNPVETISIAGVAIPRSPLDSRYVWPRELMVDPRSKVYATIDTDPWG